LCVDVYKHNDGVHLTEACMKFVIMQKMVTHKTNYGNNRVANL